MPPDIVRSSNPAAFANSTKSGKFSLVFDIFFARSISIKPKSSPALNPDLGKRHVNPDGSSPSRLLTSKTSKNSPPQAIQNSTHQKGRSPTSGPYNHSPANLLSTSHLFIDEGFST
ncbi:hypothetical protein, partial [Adlercreutzia sp.]|uniref:hypothetical protein n=1 Tax=Adlercreutzia sp. TaxID=1872387 RepID=UPI003AB4A669